MADYRVNLDIFEGPLDLLLYLVRKEEVDIYDIPISHITEQYIKYIEMLKSLDIDLAGDFLVMAATLMEIKSVMLLPQPELEEDQEQDFIDPRAELVRQLLEYKKFKDAANLLEDSADLRKERFTRPDTVISKLKSEAAAEPEIDIDQVSVWMLLEAFDNIMQATGNYASYDHIQDDTPIDLYQIEILHRLQTEGAMTMENVFKYKENRFVLIGLFLAMLELIRANLITAEQPKQLGPIFIRSLTDVPAEQAVPEAIFSDHNIENSSKAASQSSPSEEKPESAIPIQEISPQPDHIEKTPVDTQENTSKDSQN